MNRHEFLSVLIGELRSIDPSELQNILQYYNEYFDDAGAENEAAVIAELGDPKALGAKLRASSAVRFLEEKPTKSGKSMKAVWIAILSIFAAPIALPIAIAIAAVAFSLFIVIISLFITFFAMGITFGAGALLGFLASIVALVDTPAASISFLGVGLLMTGFCLLTIIPTAKLTAYFFKSLALLINKGLVKKHSRNDRNKGTAPQYPYPPAYSYPTSYSTPTAPAQQQPQYPQAATPQEAPVNTAEEALNENAVLPQAQDTQLLPQVKDEQSQDTQPVDETKEIN